MSAMYRRASVPTVVTATPTPKSHAARGRRTLGPRCEGAACSMRILLVMERILGRGLHRMVAVRRGNVTAVTNCAKLVEAAGIEPASVDPPQSGLHAQPGSLMPSPCARQPAS